MKSSSSKNHLKQYIDHNPIEAVREFGGSFSDSVKSNAKESINDLWDQLLGGAVTPRANHGDLSEGQEISFAKKDTAPKHTPEQQPKLDVLPGIDYRREIVQSATKVERENQNMLEQQIQQILSELKRIVSTSQELASTYKEIAVEQRVEHAGTYHVNFFEWVLAVMQNARMKIEDSGAWLSVMKGKKGKQGYWDMFQKHGTTFGQSNERAIATQAG